MTSSLVSPTASSACAAVPATFSAARLTELRDSLQNAFGVEFALWDAASGLLLHRPADQPAADDALRAELVRTLAGKTEATFLADEDSVLLFALPFNWDSEGEVTIVAVAPFATRRADPGESLASAARLLGLTPDQTRLWLASQEARSPAGLKRTAKLLLALRHSQRAERDWRGELDKISLSLVRTYEEICLLHSVTQNLRISSDDESLGKQVVQWLSDCLPIGGVGLQFLPVAREADVTYRARTHAEFVQIGQTHLDNERLLQLIEYLEIGAGSGPRVVNPAITQGSDWPFPEIKQLILVPLAEGTRLLGWLVAVNHAADLEFGTVEASLLNSIATMLGIHISNRDLYRQQAEFLASVVRAMTSAIDAKDPYTCGHSDRVARISVRLAQELACEQKMLHTLYMAGLLHDIGKIGINDGVLRKPGRLTEEEFEHIKQHPELGYRILADLKPLNDVLPAVLHHHEQWDGQGYPCRLREEQIPLIARIVAVADAYDAMSSDRPYRKGMPGDKVDQIFKSGAGVQWDPDVVAAFFAAREDIRLISSHERANLTLDVQQWL